MRNMYSVNGVHAGVSEANDVYGGKHMDFAIRQNIVTLLQSMKVIKVYYKYKHYYYYKY